MWIIPHTHWDREWYEPHDIFRARLIDVLDSLLDLLEHPNYRFTLDGQAAAVLDYLELRPLARGRVRGAVERGQLAIGPFLILLDEFCCDGETIVRNLELGISACSDLGGAMRVGYLPDMFGHCAQMPQILRGFGIADAALWRGVPARVERDAFIWASPEGAAVRVEYLWDGYGSALKLLDIPEQSPQAVRAYLDENRERFTGHRPAGMFGTDHMPPRKDLLELLKSHHQAGGPPLHLATLDEVVEGRREEDPSDLPEVIGEMRSHARGNILPGVLSIRSELKIAMARAERSATVAERLDSVLGGPCRKLALDRVWGLIIESSAHDSVTGCGVDATAAEVKARLGVARHSAEGVIDTSLRALAPGELTAVANPIPHSRPALLELTVPPDQMGETMQVVGELPTVLGDEEMEADELPRLLRRIHGTELFGHHIISWTMAEHTLTFQLTNEPTDPFDLMALSAAIDDARATGGTWRIRTLTEPRLRAIVSVPCSRLGLTSIDPFNPPPPTHPVLASGSSLTNGLVTIHYEGGLTIEDHVSGTRLDDAIRLIDESDRGDSYNFGPTNDEPITARLVESRISETGPVRGRIILSYELIGAFRFDRAVNQRAGEVSQRIDVTVELRADESFVRLGIRFVNRALDHRLRIHVACREVEGSTSGGQFSATARGRKAEGGWGEYPLPTFPAYRWVSAGGTTIHTDRLMEYELVPDGLALTLLRSVGLMSVNVHPLRDEPAGSQIPVPGAQNLDRELTYQLAIDLGTRAGIPTRNEIFRLNPLWRHGTGELPSFPTIELAEGSVVLESLRRREGRIEARFVNYSVNATPLGAQLPGQWDRTDLAGQTIEVGVDPAALIIGGHEIVTLRGGW